MSDSNVVAIGQPDVADQDEQRAVTQFVAAFASNRLALIGVALLFTLLAFCFLGPIVYKTDQIHTDLAKANLPPGQGNPLGTDPAGYDVLGRLMVAGQTSLEVGVAAALLAALFGTLVGAAAGYFGGTTDTVLMRIVDAFLAVPTLLLLMLFASMIEPTRVHLIGLIALFAWLYTARLVRGDTLSIRERDYITAVKGMGGSWARALSRHVIPNCVGTISVSTTFQIADAILLLAALDFLGLGLPPPTATWGGMLSTGLQYLYSGYWWQIYPAGLAIIITVLAFNFIGDGLRDAFESRLRAR